MAKTLVLLLSCGLVIVALLFVGGEAKLVDIDREAFFIVSRHNQERRSRQLNAADMMEMRWDETLARMAGQWSEKCRYERPPRSGGNRGVNSNLYYETDHVFGQKASRRMIDSALQTWARAQSRFSYSRHCGRACSYVQMIQSSTYRVGCALSTCEDLRSGNTVAEFASLFVCFYSPGRNLMNSVPFHRGPECSRCSDSMECRSGLCALPGSQTLPPRLLQMADEQRRQPAQIVQPQDKLTSKESYDLIQAHTKIRDAQRVSRLSQPLTWDPYLERWAVWVVSCEADFPGPAHTYTNFERLDQGSSVYDKVYDWSLEGYNPNLKLAHGCRTPDDQMKCNHFTNLLQPDITSMACAARDCRDASRQLVCLYDNMKARDRRVMTATAALSRLEADTSRSQAIVDSRRPRTRRPVTRRRPRPRAEQPPPSNVRDRRNRRRGARGNGRRRHRNMRKGQRIDNFYGDNF